MKRTIITGILALVAGVALLAAQAAPAAPAGQAAPAAAAQGAVDEEVALPIAPEFLPPEKRVAGGHAAMPGTTVPETAIHKQGDPRRAENKVGLAEDRLMPPPARDTVGAEPFDHHHFRGPVAVRTDAGHDGGAFGFGENVRHFMPCTFFQVPVWRVPGGR